MAFGHLNMLCFIQETKIQILKGTCLTLGTHSVKCWPKSVARPNRKANFLHNLKFENVFARVSAKFKRCGNECKNCHSFKLLKCVMYQYVKYVYSILQ